MPFQFGSDNTAKPGNPNAPHGPNAPPNDPKAVVAEATLDNVTYKFLESKREGNQVVFWFEVTNPAADRHVALLKETKLVDEVGDALSTSDRMKGDTVMDRL